MNECERPEDAARRYARQVIELESALARSESARKVAVGALRRLLDRFELLLARRSVRDVAETIGEVRAALAQQPEENSDGD